MVGVETKEWLPAVSALVGTGLGWSLNQLGQLFLYRREHRKAVSKALLGLLEVREQLKRIPEALQVLGQKLQIPSADQVVLAVVLDGFFPTDDGWVKKFEESLLVLAEHDPVLAYRLRGKGLAVPLLRQLRQMSASNRDAAEFWGPYERRLMSEVLPRLDEVIEELGATLSRRTRKKVRQVLSEEVKLPDELIDALLQAIREQIERQQAAARLASAKEPAAALSKRVPVWQQHPRQGEESGER